MELKHSFFLLIARKGQEYLDKFDILATYTDVAKQMYELIASENYEDIILYVRNANAGHHKVFAWSEWYGIELDLIGSHLYGKENLS